MVQGGGARPGYPATPGAGVSPYANLAGGGGEPDQPLAEKYHALNIISPAGGQHGAPSKCLRARNLF